MQKRATRYQPRVFFSGGGVESQRTPLGSLRSLLNQLFRQDEVVRPLVRDEYREKCHAFGGSGHGWHWQLEQLLQDSIVLSAQQRQVTIFVDELDGVGAKFALEIAAYFHQVSDSVVAKLASVKIFISCRHYPVPTIRPGVSICMDQHNKSDITTYVKDRLDVDHLGAPDNPERIAWSHLQADIISQSGGVFQGAHLIVALINSKLADGESMDHARR